MGTKTRYAALFPPTPHVWWCNASGSLNDSVACNRFACPIDCKVSGNADAAAADKTTTRSAIALTAHGDLAAPALTQINPCNRFCCPVDGNVPSWTTCTKTCGTMGTKTRYAALFPSMPHVWWCNEWIAHRLRGLQQVRLPHPSTASSPDGLASPPALRAAAPAPSTAPSLCSLPLRMSTSRMPRRRQKKNRKR